MALFSDTAPFGNVASNADTVAIGNAVALDDRVR